VVFLKHNGQDHEVNAPLRDRADWTR